MDGPFRQQTLYVIFERPLSQINESPSILVSSKATLTFNSSVWDSQDNWAGQWLPLPSPWWASPGAGAWTGTHPTTYDSKAPRWLLPNLPATAGSGQLLHWSQQLTLQSGKGKLRIQNQTSETLFYKLAAARALNLKAQHPLKDNLFQPF